MKLILTRHGETIENKKGILQGQKIGTLSKKGIKQAKKLALRLKGKKIDDTLIEKASQAASIDCCPISDVRASAEYRQEMVKVFTRRAIRQAMAK